MNRIESAVDRNISSVQPLDGITSVVPVSTPWVVAGVVGGAFLVGAAVGCAEGHCVQDSAELQAPDGASAMSVSDLLVARTVAL